MKQIDLLLQARWLITVNSNNDVLEDHCLAIDNGIIVARTDSEGAGLTKEIAVVKEPGDQGDVYNSFLDVEEIDVSEMAEGDVCFNRDGKLVRPKRLPSGLYQFREGTGHERCVFDCIEALNAGADEDTAE